MHAGKHSQLSCLRRSERDSRRVPWRERARAANAFLCFMLFQFNTKAWERPFKTLSFSESSNIKQRILYYILHTNFLAYKRFQCLNIFASKSNFRNIRSFFDSCLRGQRVDNSTNAVVCCRRLKRRELLWKAPNALEKRGHLKKKIFFLKADTFIIY